MTTKHTPEPWTIGVAYDGGWDIGPEAVLPLPDPGPDAIATAYTEEDAARIVACVNALAGINPEAVPLMLNALQQAESALWLFVTTLPAGSALKADAARRHTLARTALAALEAK